MRMCLCTNMFICTCACAYACPYAHVLLHMHGEVGIKVCAWGGGGGAFEPPDPWGGGWKRGSCDRAGVKPILLKFSGLNSRRSLRGIKGARIGPRGAVPLVRSTVMSFKAMFGRCYTLFWRIQRGEGKRKKLTIGGARGSFAVVAMPNPLIKWAKRNTHPDPLHPSGAKKVAATCPFLTPT